MIRGKGTYELAEQWHEAKAYDTPPEGIGKVDIARETKTASALLRHHGCAFHCGWDAGNNRSVERQRYCTLKAAPLLFCPKKMNFFFYQIYQNIKLSMSNSNIKYQISISINQYHWNRVTASASEAVDKPSTKMIFRIRIPRCNTIYGNFGVKQQEINTESNFYFKSNVCAFACVDEYEYMLHAVTGTGTATATITALQITITAPVFAPFQARVRCRCGFSKHCLDL